MGTATIGALRVDLALNAGEFSRGLQRSTKEVGDFGSAMSKLSDRMEAASYEFNSGMMAAQRFASVIGSIVNVAREFGSGMSAVSTLVDTNTESMKQMSEAVLEIGRRTPVALTDLTGGLYDLRSAGTSAEDAMGRLEKSAQLGVAGLGSTKEAVDLVTSSINAFGLKGREADDVYNNIFKTIQAGKTTISGLAQGFGAVASTVSAAGVSLKEYLASIAALTVTGVPAAVAHTQIRAAVAGLTRESELGTKVLDAMGAKTFKELIDKSGGMVAAFKNVTIALGGNDAAMIKLFGSVEAYNAVLSLTGKQNASFVANMTKMNDGLDAVQEGFNKRNEGMGAAMDKMRNAIQELGIALGDALTPTIKAVSEMVVGMTTTFKSLSPELQSALTQFALLAAVFAPAVAAIGFFVNALGSVVGVVATVGAAIAGLIVVGGPIVAFGVAAGAAVTLWQIFETEIIAVWNSVYSFITAKVDALIAKLTEMRDFISGIWAAFKEGGMDAAGDAIAKAMADPWAQVETAMGGVVAMYDTLALKKAEAAKNAYTYAGPVISAADAEKVSLRDRNSAYREGLQLFNETLDPMEKLIFKQMEINGLMAQGAIDATTFNRAMANASVYSAKNMDALASSVSSNLGTIFGDTKAVAIASALINTYQGITKALATYPPPISGIMAGIQAAAGFAQVANIRKQTKSGGGSSGGGSGGGGGASASPAVGNVPQMMTVTGLTRGQFLGAEYVGDLAKALLQYQRDGGQVVIQS